MPLLEPPTTQPTTLMALPVGERPTRLPRLRSMVERHAAFVSRSLRRFGVRLSDIDDATQDVFVVVARRIDDVAADGERAFLFGTARRVASDHRRSVRRHPEQASDGIDDHATEAPDPERLVELKLARALLDEALGAMSGSIRSVFVLSELSELSGREIASRLSIPEGTVRSRLRAGRDLVRAAARRLEDADRARPARDAMLLSCSGARPRQTPRMPVPAPTVGSRA